MIKRGKKASPVLIIRATSMRFRGGINVLLVQLAVQHFGYFAFRPVFMGWFKSAHWYHLFVYLNLVPSKSFHMHFTLHLGNQKLPDEFQNLSIQGQVVLNS